MPRLSDGQPLKDKSAEEEEQLSTLVLGRGVLFLEGRGKWCCGRVDSLREGRGALGVGSKVSEGRARPGVCGTSSEGGGSERGPASGSRAVSHASAICLV